MLNLPGGSKFEIYSMASLSREEDRMTEQFISLVEKIMQQYVHFIMNYDTECIKQIKTSALYSIIHLKKL